MTGSGYCVLPGGDVIVALTLPRPPCGPLGGGTGTGANAGAGRTGVGTVRAGAGAGAGAVRTGASAPRAATATVTEASVRVLVRAKNRSRALTRLRNLGLRAVYLRGNTAPPTPDEITAVLHHPEGLLWRATPDDPYELWHPIAALLRPQGAGLRGQAA
ncbi:hypothetical protein [Streptomyces sp. CA-253872]|uniref:hypothetical protein n=1 Tax=Streptomyces sp. CA-253872 TaxID=3240067 RepID=UPI003D9113D6